MTNKVIRELVEKLLGEQFDRELKQQLAKAGKTAVPNLLAALSDPRFQKHPYRTSHSLDDKSALETILDLLDPFGPAEAVPELTRLWRMAGPQRKNVALALGNIANADCIDAVSQALRDRDEYVVSYALTGIQRGITASRATPGFMTAMLTQVEPLVLSDRLSVYDKAADVLLRLNKQEATAILVSKKYWNLDNEDALLPILEALSQHQAEVPHEKLLEMEALMNPYLEESSASIVQFRFGRAGGKILRAYEELLTLLAQRKTPGARRIILQARTTHPALESKAAEALATLEGLPNPCAFLHARCQQVGFDKLTVIQKQIYSVYDLYWSEFHNYFERWLEADDEQALGEISVMADHALDGLKMIGAHRAAQCFDEARKGGDWSSLEAAFREAENILALVMDFARKHRTEFQ